MARWDKPDVSINNKVQAFLDEEFPGKQKSFSIAGGKLQFVEVLLVTNAAFNLMMLKMRRRFPRLFPAGDQ